MAEYIERETAIEAIDEALKRVFVLPVGKSIMDRIPAADVRPVPDGGIGEMSDGYHTFNGLYYQRMVLFAALVKAHKDKAWKSWKHEDGELCFGGGWFIVGIDTPEGSYTYHYEGKDWDRFECEELPVAKHWDGHTEEDVTRLLSLDVRPVVLCKDCWFFEKDTLFCSLHEADFAPDAFCSYATTDGQAEYWGMDKEDHDRKRREES